MVGGAPPRRRKTPVDPIPAKVRAAVYERSKGEGQVRLCEVRFSAKCSGYGQHLHHKLARRHGDHSEGNLVDVCFACHHEIHASKDRKGVIALGLIVRSTQAPRKKAA